MDDSTRDSLPPAFDLGISGFDGAVAVGRGGFSVVYRAREVALERDVAIKVLQGNPDQGEWRSFERERRALGALSQHPNVVTVFATGFTNDNQPYLVMEYMPGGSLAERIAHGALAWREAVDITIKVAGALQAAHDAGVLHRDIKPGNILMSGYGEPKLADFGIARIGGGPETRTGVVSATIEHAAPEVLAGQRPTAVADVYSLGSTLYALLSGRAPFTRDTDESMAPLLARIATAPVPDLTDHGVPTPVCQVLEDALAKDPAERIQSADELAQRLDVTRTTDDDHGPPDPRLRPTIPADGHDPHRTCRRRRVAVAAVGAIVLAAGIGIVVVTRSHGTSSGASVAAPTGYVPRYVNKACPAQFHAADSRVTCGELVVPEDRAKPSGRKLQLAVVRAPPTTASSDPTPTISFDLSGSVDVSSDVRQLGEHITIEGRGGPGSTPGLECPDFTAVRRFVLTHPASSPDARTQLVSAARACRAMWTKEGVDLASYGSSAEALDVRDLAWVLKITSVNFEARSEDTAVALKVAALAPRLVRAFVLEDVVPPGLLFSDGAIENGRRAFAHYVTACVAQPTCKRAHPDLQASLAEAYARLQANPATISVPDPTDPAKPPIPVLLDGDQIVFDTVASLADPLAVPLLASTLDSAQLSIAAQYDTNLQLGAPSEQLIAEDVRACVDDVPKNPNLLGLQAEAVAAPMYSSLEELSTLDACAVIIEGLAGSRLVMPSPPGVPTLILVGELNSQSSQPWADDTAQIFGNATVVMLPNLTSDPVGNGPPCVAQLRLDFLRHPQQRPNVHACIASIPPVQFAGT